MKNGDRLKINLNFAGHIPKFLQKQIIGKQGNEIYRYNLSDSLEASFDFTSSSLLPMKLVIVLVTEKFQVTKWTLGSLTLEASAPAYSHKLSSQNDLKVEGKNYPLYWFVLTFIAILGIFTSNVSKLGLTFSHFHEKFLSNMLLQFSVLSLFILMLYSWIKLDAMSTLKGLIIPCAFAIIVGKASFK